MNKKRLFATLVTVLPFFLPTFGQEGNKEIIAKKVTGSIFRPKQLTPTPALTSTLDLPPGSPLPRLPTSWGNSVCGAIQPVSPKPRQIGTLQVNVGKMCNQTCKHCHMQATVLRAMKTEID